MKVLRRTLLLLAAAAAALPTLPHVAEAQAYPIRPITMIVPGDTIIPIVYGPCPLGGIRPYFLCCGTARVSAVPLARFGAKVAVPLPALHWARLHQQVRAPLAARVPARQQAAPAPWHHWARRAREAQGYAGARLCPFARCDVAGRDTGDRSRHAPASTACGPAQAAVHVGLVNSGSY